MKRGFNYCDGSDFRKPNATIEALVLYGFIIGSTLMGVWFGYAARRFETPIATPYPIDMNVEDQCRYVPRAKQCRSVFDLEPHDGPLVEADRPPVQNPNDRRVSP